MILMVKDARRQSLIQSFLRQHLPLDAYYVSNHVAMKDAHE